MKKYVEFITDLKKIKQQGFIQTHRSGNTGIGKTLEDLLGIDENNVAGPDGHQTELKSARKGSSSMLTLFTKSPNPPKINPKLAKRFGKDVGNGRKRLHSTCYATGRNESYNDEGFLLTVNTDRIELDRKDYGDMSTPYWEKQALEKSFIRKYPKNLLYVKADSEGKNADEKFHFNEAWLMNGFDFDNFIDLLKKGMIKVDIRIGLYANGRSHDHGTAFRVLEKNLDLCFSSRRQVI